MRVVSLCPSLTELVFDLGCGDDLVGITDYCVHPADRVARVEKVGGTKTPDLARIVELEPDLVLLNEEENRREDAEDLISKGVRCDVSFPRTCAETADMVRSIAATLGAVTLGEQLACDIEARTERVCGAAKHLSPVRYAYLIWRKPWMTVNDDTFVHALLSCAGGVNVFGENADRYPKIDSAALKSANPDTVLLSSEPFPFEQKHIVELSAETGIDQARFQIVDGEYLSWYGSRTPDGIDYAESVLVQARAHGA